MCVGLTEICDCDNDGGRVGRLVATVLLGPRPGMLTGKQVENRGSVVLNSVFDHDFDAKSSIVPSMSRSTSISSVLSSLTPVCEELPLQTPSWSDRILVKSSSIGVMGVLYLPYSAVRVTSTSGNLTERSTEAEPIFTSWTPKDILGSEYAPSVTAADISLTLNNGVKSPPLNPVAELESGFLRSATSWALFGSEDESPKSTLAVPWKDAVPPTEYESMVPRLNICGISMPASGVGNETNCF